MIRFILPFLFLVGAVSAHAAAVSATPVKVEYTVTPVPVSSWLEIDSALLKAIKGFSVTNISTNRMALAVGASGSEVAQVYIPAASSNAYFPLVVSGSNRISIKSLDNTATTGMMLINFFYN